MTTVSISTLPVKKIIPLYHYDVLCMTWRRHFRTDEILTLVSSQCQFLIPTSTEKKEVSGTIEIRLPPLASHPS